PSMSNPIFGTIQGVGRGAEIIDLPRSTKLRPVQKKQAAATKNYNRWAQDVLTRCEDISLRSQCWLYIAIHHPQSKAPFYHYTSPKLRREAPDQLASFHKLVSKTMSSVMQADRKGKVDIQAELLIAQEHALEAESRAKSNADEVERLKRLLASYQ
ncbi:hypothetical protein BKA70DRAFT_1024846, partial [Coprinopsis sp. MPI-PUGE-AT-0042]